MSRDDLTFSFLPGFKSFESSAYRETRRSFVPLHARTLADALCWLHQFLVGLLVDCIIVFQLSWSFHRVGHWLWVDVYRVVWTAREIDYNRCVIGKILV